MEPKVGMYNIYIDPLSQPSRSVWLFLKAIGAPLNVTFISLMKDEQKKDDFKKVSPFSKVPVLVHRQKKAGGIEDVSLTEGPAIATYIANTHKCADHWYPAEPKKRARVDEYLSYQHTTVRKAGSGVVFKYVFEPDSTEEEKEAAIKNVHKELAAFEAYFLKDDFIAGKEVSIADIFALSEILMVLLSGQDFLAEYKKIKPWAIRTREALQPHFKEVFKGLFDVVNKETYP